MLLTLKTRVFSDATGAYTEVPAILTPVGWLMPLVDYFLEHRNARSRTWMLKVARSVALFLEYLAANPAQQNPRDVFVNFGLRLYTGTFDMESGLDPSWLCWGPMSQVEATKTIRRLSDFFEWLGKSRPAAAQINPKYIGSAYDRTVDEAAYQFRREKAFLGHGWSPHLDPEKGNKGYLFRGSRPPKVERGDPPAFPEDRFIEFLFEGFKVGGELNYRDICITLLLHGAGFRASEPFHLYFGDVFPDPSNPGQAMVLIHHPSQGEAPGDWFDERGKPRKGNRAAYLAQNYGLSPRNLLLDSRAAGWKGGTHDAKYYKRAYWFIPEFGELFLKCWSLYLQRAVQASCKSHPFAFINLSQEPKGGMYCLAQYNKAHSRACERIGLTVGKDLGTTPHGHRHAYGRRLVGGKVSREMIRRFMHHADLDSQEVYTTPTTEEMIEELRVGVERMNVSLLQKSIRKLEIL